MELASLSARPNRLLSRLHPPTGAAMSSLALVFLYTLALANSTTTAAWLPGLNLIPLVALAASLLLAFLALSPLSSRLALSTTFLLGFLVAIWVTLPTLRSAYPQDPSGIPWLFTWMARLSDPAAVISPAFELLLAYWLLWCLSGWLSWCVLRFHRALLGLFPLIALFAANLLDFPSEQNGNTLSILILTFGLLLWSNYTSARTRARLTRLRVGSDVSWDFWESALVVMAVLVVLGIMLPPLSTVASFQNSSLFGSGSGSNSGFGVGPGTTGFSTEVPLGGALVKSTSVVFTYTVTGGYAAPRYFRGVNVTSLAHSEWSYPNLVPGVRSIAKDAIIPYDENYQKLAVASFNVKMLSPPFANTTLLFYPGQLYHLNRPTAGAQTLIPLTSQGFLTLDSLTSLAPTTSAGTYVAVVEYSTATPADLQASGSVYPAWLTPYMGLPANGYRGPQVLSRIHSLALKITASATTPYEKALAIESYLRSNYSYTLTPPITPAGTDPLDYFLFHTKKGYCEFFATAMGDMLRSLNIPARLVNGFGPGTFDANSSSYLVRSQDAHTWVESYFPTYGWIPFEPTPDGTYFPVSRGASGPNLCLRDNNCDNPVALAGNTPISPPSNDRAGGNQQVPGASLSNPVLRFSPFNTVVLLVALTVFLTLVLLLLAATLLYLRPLTVMAIWHRTMALAALAGTPLSPHETPFEVTHRLGATFPELTLHLRQLANAFVLAAYAPPDLAPSASSASRAAWASLRPLLLRRVLIRFHFPLLKPLAPTRQGKPLGS